MGVLTRTDLDSLIGHLPTQAGLKGVTADDEDLSDDWPTDGGRAHATALSGDALRDSLLPQVTQGSDRTRLAMNLPVVVWALSRMLKTESSNVKLL